MSTSCSACHIRMSATTSRSPPMIVFMKAARPWMTVNRVCSIATTTWVLTLTTWNMTVMTPAGSTMGGDSAVVECQKSMLRGYRLTRYEYRNSRPTLLLCPSRAWPCPGVE